MGSLRRGPCGSIRGKQYFRPTGVPGLPGVPGAPLVPLGPWRDSMEIGISQHDIAYRFKQKEHRILTLAPEAPVSPEGPVAP